MKKLIYTLAYLLAAAPLAMAQNWKVDDAHSKVSFSVKYLGISETEGKFEKMSGTITSAKEDWTDLKAEVTLDVNSINTDNAQRDGHLKQDDFFNAEKYPSIKFKSSGIKSVGKNMYVIMGELTIRDVTKKVELPVVYGGQVKDPWGNQKAGFKATGSINRKDYGLKFNAAAGTGEAVVGDDVNFTIDLVLIKA